MITFILSWKILTVYQKMLTLTLTLQQLFSGEKLETMFSKPIDDIINDTQETFFNKITLSNYYNNNNL